MIRVISKIQYDSESPINSVYESVGFFEKTWIIKLWQSMQIKVHHSPIDLALRAKSHWAQKFWRCPGHSGTCAGHVTTPSRWTTPGLTEPRAMPSKASSKYSPASNRAEQSFEYRPKLNRIEPDLSLEPSRVGYRASQDTNWAEPSWASTQAGPNL